MDQLLEILGSQAAGNVASYLELVIIIVGFIATLSSLKQGKDSRNIDFVINAEGQIDPLFLSIAEQDPHVIRAMFPKLIPASVADSDLKTLVLTYYAYRHASRMYYLFANDDISLGMNEMDRKRMAEEWMSELKKYNLDYIRIIHDFSHISDEFNAGFISFVDEMLAKHGVATPSSS